LKTLLAVATVVTAIGISSMPVFADGAGAVSSTVTIQDTTLPPAPVLGPCAPPGTLASASDVNAIFHLTALTSGIGATTYWFTGTLQGQGAAVTPAGVTYTGPIAVWFGANNNLQNDEIASTFAVQLRAPDGSTLDLHVAFEANNTSSGQTNLVMQFSC
jgi:hypothetical protein